MPSRGLVFETNLVARDLRGIEARFRLADQTYQQNVRGSVQRFHRNVRRTTSTNAPRRSGYMASHVEIRFSQDRLSAETGWFKDTFERDWHLTRGRFYPVYQEFIWHPSLGPAYNQHVAAFVLEVRKAGVMAVARARR